MPALASPSRLAHAAEAGLELAHALLGCSLFHHLHPGGAGSSAPRALAALLLGNGVAALVLAARASPLPYRRAAGSCGAAGGAGRGGALRARSCT